MGQKDCRRLEEVLHARGKEGQKGAAGSVLTAMHRGDVPLDIARHRRSSDSDDSSNGSIGSCTDDYKGCRRRHDRYGRHVRRSKSSDRVSIAEVVIAA